MPTRRSVILSSGSLALVAALRSRLSLPHIIARGAVATPSNASVAGYPRTYALAISGDASGNQNLPPVPYSSQVTGNQINSSGYFPSATYGSDPCAWAGRYDAVLLGANWEGADSSGTYDRALMVDAIKQICGLQTPYLPTYCIQYDIMESMHQATITTPTSGYATNAALANQVNTLKTWLYSAASQGGSIVTGPPGSPSPFGETNWAVNVSTDSQYSPGRGTAYYNGLSEDFPQFAGAYHSDLHFLRHISVATVVSGTIAAAAYKDPRFYPLSSGYSNDDANKAPNMDAIYYDNSFCYPRYTGFYDLVNSYSANSYGTIMGPAMARGLQHVYARFKAIMAVGYPTRTFGVGGNIGVSLLYIWQNETTAFFNSVISELGSLDHALFENVIAASGTTFESTYGTNQLILGIQAIISGLSIKVPGIGITPASATDYQTMRHGLAAAAMAGAYGGGGTSYQISAAMWPDEQGGNPSTNIPKNWLGAQVGPAPTAPAVNGIWVREFSNGVVLDCPRGNTGVSISLAQINTYLGTSLTLNHFTGVQNSSLNSGGTFSSWTPASTSSAGDGLFLVKA